MAGGGAASGAKKQPLTLAQLSSYDDMLTDALVDRAFYWTTIPKNRPSYHPSRGVKEAEVTQIIQSHLIVDPDLDLAERKLLATDGLKRFHNALKTAKEKLDFKQHMRRYLQIYLPDCPFEVSSTNRYTVTTHEACVVARRTIRRNESVKYLSGIQVLITPEEEAALSVRKKDFSIVVSSRSKMASLFMGPARFANHDCGANAKLVITGQAGIDIVAVRTINVGEEVTVTYGDNYFGEANCECLCQTCEDNLANGWRQPEGAVQVKKSIEHDATAAQGYNTRGRRRYGRGDSSSRTPSITPDVRPKVPKTRARLLLDGERASTTESSSLLGDGPGPGSVQKRNRDSDSLATPPVTPAKRQKTSSTTRYEIPVAAPAMERSASSEDDTAGMASISVSSNGEAVLTDVTTPVDTTDPAETLPQITPISEVIENLKQEQDPEEASSTGLQQVALFPEGTQVTSSACAPAFTTPKPPRRVNGISIRDILNTPSVHGTPAEKSSEDRFAAAFGAETVVAVTTTTSSSSSTTTTTTTTTAPAPAPAETGPVNGTARDESPDPLSADVVDIEPSPAPVVPVKRGRGRPRRVPVAPVVHVASATTRAAPSTPAPTAEHPPAVLLSSPPESQAEESTPARPPGPESISSTAARGAAVLGTAPIDLPLMPATRLPSHRQPGDYQLTPRLLSEPDMAWVRCMNCARPFVQQNAYYTRSSCPRCERHSKLYGYVWPKTQRDGPYDKEERILDHRTVHRFLTLDDEMQVRGRAAIKRPLMTLTTVAAARKQAWEGEGVGSGGAHGLGRAGSLFRRDSDSPSAGSEVRRSGRRRTASLKAVSGG
ncbi:hypothetical protein BD289DRAFT_454968 [Coniella lustricola]|uniref:Histone-lysine N-methyltransferase SET9 n=1 Tax=Coniella lustricola TaxID=2025994 RepID=A0A2T3A1G9_9PEZI|nr:hypothetical protein BD289DRAFT_454968 [Coniella lustricola]